MRTVSNDAGQIKLRELIEVVQNEPVTILEQGEPVAVVLSPTEFDRLEEQARVRREAKGVCARRSLRCSGKRPSAA